jgi:hypothetical protein
MSTKISKEQLQKILVQEAKNLQSQGYTKEQIKEIFDNRFVKSVGDRARSLFKGSRDKSPVQSKELPADFDRKKITPQDLIDLIFNDPNVPQYIKNIAATLEYKSEEAHDSEQSKYDEVPLFDEEGDDDMSDGEVEDPAMLDMDIENAVEKTKPAPKNPETKNTDSKPPANKAQASSSKPRTDKPAAPKSPPAKKSQNKPNKNKPKTSSAPKAKANGATPFKNVAKKKSLKESILDRLPEKDRNDPKVKQLVEAIEKQYNKKKV